MAANWGIQSIGTDGDWSVNQCIAMMGISPATADMVLDSVSIYCKVHTNQIRVAVYQGGAAADPAGATLIEDLGQTAGSATSAWIVVNSGINPALTASTRTWVVVKGNDGGFQIPFTNDSGEAEDYSTDGGWFEGNISTDETEAYPATWPASSGFFDNYWFSIYLTYSISEGGLWTTHIHSTIVFS